MIYLASMSKTHSIMAKVEKGTQNKKPEEGTMKACYYQLLDHCPASQNLASFL